MPERPRKLPRLDAAARVRLGAVLAGGAASSAPDRIPRREDRTGPWPLSSSQERVWLADRLLGPSALYAVPIGARLSGPLDAGALDRALVNLVGRHELLRARFRIEDERPVQTTSAQAGPSIAFTSLEDEPASRREARALALAREMLRRPFDLEREPPVRAALWRLAADEHLFLLAMHHVACDAATVRILCRELEELYAAALEGRAARLAGAPLQHGDYAAWERSRLASGVHEAALASWAERLREPPGPVELPADRPRPAQRSVEGAWLTRTLPPGTAAAIEALARAHCATPFQVFLTAFHALLHRWTGQHRLAIGIPVSLRERTELEELPGFLVNTLPLCTAVEGSLRFVELLERVREGALFACEHAGPPLERVLERADRGERDALDVMFDHRAGLSTELCLGRARGRLLAEDELHSGTSKVDLALYTELCAGEARVSAEYRSARFDTATMARLLNSLEVLLAAALRDPYARVGSLPLLAPEERARVTETFARGADVAGAETTVHAAVAAQAARAPDAIALEEGDLRVTYGELVQRAHRLAHALAERGAKRGAIVALCLSRSVELVIAELAVLETGAAYLPLDPGYPAERLAFMLADSGAQLLVTEEALDATVPAGAARRFVLERERDAIARQPADAPEPRAEPEDPAYLIYTSGSTGAPKGVACPHRGVLRLFAHADWLRFDPPVRMVHLAPESFDASVLDTWGPLTTGGTVILHPERTPTLAGLARVVERHRVDTLFLTTALFHALVDEAPEVLCRLRQVATGGEALSLAHLARARAHAPALAIANCYGPTEATVIATRWIAPPAIPRELPSTPIGSPIGATRVYVLDGHLEPLPIGVPGELFVGGAAIACGYWHRDELTRERFLDDPFASGRMYRTGDRARWQPDGTLEFLGRSDDQVKIRGQRVEPGEVEARLCEHPGVRTARVVVREDAPGARRLVAYVVPREPPPSSPELARFLEERVPEALRPSAHVLLAELPLLPGGKVDVTRLPAPAAELPASEAPRGATEELLASLWSDLLSVPAIARDDDFFALGGHSLAATVCLARVQKHLGVELPLATLFRERTLARLARAVDAARGGAHAPPPLRPRPRTDEPAPVAFNQRGLWFLQALAPASPFYNVPFAVSLGGALDVVALERSLVALVERHESLRTRFPFVDGEPVQLVERAHAPLRTLDLRSTAADERARSLQTALEAFAREPFALEEGPLFRALLVRTEDERATLAINVHHIVFDGWSLDVLLDDLVRLYAATAAGSGATLPPPSFQFADHAVAQRADADGERADAAVAFWKRELADAPPVLPLPTDRPRPATPSWRGGRVQRSLSRALVQRLEAVARAEHATPFLVALAAAEVLLARTADVQDLVVGTPAAARSRPETEDAIGLFVNVVPQRARFAETTTFREHLRATRESLLAALAHQDFPFERLVDALGVARGPALTPVYQVLFSMRRSQRARTAGALTVERVAELDAGAAKTDLAITLEERDGDWLLDLTFAEDLFERATPERFGEHFERLLDSSLSDPGRCVWDLELLGDEERRTLERWSGTAVPYPRDESLAALFARAVERSPDSVAVVHGSATLTYRMLAERAHRLAHHLVALGVERGTRVGLCADRSPAMVVALLAILEAGGAYVPLDPLSPPARLTFLLDDAGCTVVLVDAALRDAVPASAARVVVLEEAEASALRSSDAPLEPRTTGEDLAYVMYTSGSTGQPKGVRIPQRAASRLVLGTSFTRLDATRRILQLAPLSFDASTLEIWGALLHGARLVLYPGRVPDPAELERVLRDERVTTLWLTAALFNAIVDERPQALFGLEECLTGGEALSVVHVRRAQELLPPTVQLVNGYGPTENTTFTCCHRIPRPLPDEIPSVPIGRPIENTSVFVVDARLRPVPIGVPGELVTGGDGLALGYGNRPELDAERFVPGPFGAGRVYRTGDRVRWLADGGIEFLGRTDDQVKIRGHRIEPGEVAVVLGTHPAVRKAFVAVHEHREQGRSLVAYLEAHAVLPADEELERWLARRVPDYMIPSAFVALEELPMSQNGKVDRKRLPEPRIRGRARSTKPRNELEQHLAALWRDVLGVESVGPQDDFFDLGGHSLLAVKLVQRIRDTFGQELELASLVSAPTLADQAQLLHQGVGTQRSGALVKLQSGGARPPVFCVCSLGGTVLNQRPLALALGPEQPFYGLQAVDLEARLGREPTIEDYAAAYIDAMKSVAPRGPYAIGGHSFGGIVSLEIAQQLTGRGDEVDLLFILDSSLPNLQRGALDRLACAFAFLRGLPYLPAEALEQVRRDPGHAARALQRKLRFVRGAKEERPAPSAPPPGPGAAMDVGGIVDMAGWPENNRRIAQRHWRAVTQYRPQPYPGRITLFRSRFQSPLLGLGNQMGWERVALGGVDVVRVPGGHLSVLQPPNVDVLARRLTERLARRRRAA